MRDIHGAHVDFETLAFWAAGIDTPDPGRTHFENVRRLVSGHQLEPDGTTHAIVDPPTNVAWLNEDAEVLAARLRQALFTAVERATDGARIVAVLLGGLDSSALLAILSRIRSADSIRAITIDFPGRDADRSYAETLCRQLGVRWTLVGPRRWSPLSRFLLLDDSPYPMLYGGGELAAYVAAADAGADLALTAVLGDAIFGGHLQQLGSVLLWKHPSQAVRLALGATLPDAYSSARRIRQFLLVPNVRRVLPRQLRVMRTRRQWRRAMPWATHAFLERLEPALESSWTRYAVPSTPSETFLGWATSAELTGLVEVSDALAREVGIRWREALADADLIDLLSAIPIERLLHDQTFRGLLRLALKGILPEPALSRESKAELRANLDVLAHPEDQALLHDLADGRALARAGFVEPRAFRQAFERAQDHFWIWRFLAAEAFLRKFDAQR